MDGEAIVQCFAAGNGADCLKDVIQKCGTRIKVYSAIKNFLSKVFYRIHEPYACTLVLHAI